jgi:alkylglycerol monooxygenase
VHDYVALAVPLFFVFIGIELVWARAVKKRVYRFVDSITDLACGVTQQVTLLFFAATQLGIYAWLHHRSLVTFDSPWAPWLIAFLGIDFLYYWWHRASHEVNFFWAAHVVHHQSEDYNLAVALRQSVLTSWTALPFYLPLALVGVPPLVFATTHAFSTLYQFWIHTQLVGKVRGPADWILNLPSHHRVHHAINPEYLDTNYGATLIVWDRLFGTYAEEIATPVYGITKPLASFNPIWAQVHYWPELVAMTRRARGLDKLRVWIASPAWKPREATTMGAAMDDDARAAGVAAMDDEARAAGVAAMLGRAKFDCPLSPRVTLYVAVQFALVVALAFSMLMWRSQISTSVVAVGAAVVVLSLAALGGLMERKRWAVAAESSRLAFAAAAIVVLVV